MSLRKCGNILAEVWECPCLKCPPSTGPRGLCHGFLRQGRSTSGLPSPAKRRELPEQEGKFQGDARVVSRTSRSRERALRAEKKTRRSRDGRVQRTRSQMDPLDPVLQTGLNRVLDPPFLGRMRSPKRRKRPSQARPRKRPSGSISLHEGMIERHGLSPLKVPEQEAAFSSWSAPLPVALQRSFALGKPIVSLSATVTARAVASKHVLVGIAPGQVAALDRRLLDPRRPSLDDASDRAQRQAVQRELDEGLQPRTSLCSPAPLLRLRAPSSACAPSGRRHPSSNPPRSSSPSASTCSAAGERHQTSRSF
ncbi:hypothetical protein M885DRAFT_258282 [Pelagophyceae sp. CCMP2097]|nr:hypothetical protein M885DRAFT_258282 [Pelagophyceae sp. CCMP2097]